MKNTLSVNSLAWKLLEKLCGNPDFYGVKVERASSGATIVDAGVSVKEAFKLEKS